MSMEEQRTSRKQQLLIYQQSRLLLDQLDLVKEANMNAQSVPSFMLLASELLKSLSVDHDQMIDSTMDLNQLWVNSVSYDFVKDLLFHFAFLACSNYASFRLGTYHFAAADLHQVIQVSQAFMKRKKYHAIYATEEGYHIDVSGLPFDFKEYQKQYALVQTTKSLV